MSHKRKRHAAHEAKKEKAKAPKEPTFFNKMLHSKALWIGTGLVLVCLAASIRFSTSSRNSDILKGMVPPRYTISDFRREDNLGPQRRRIAQIGKQSRSGMLAPAEAEKKVIQLVQNSVVLPGFDPPEVQLVAQGMIDAINYDGNPCNYKRALEASCAFIRDALGIEIQPSEVLAVSGTPTTADLYTIQKTYPQPNRIVLQGNPSLSALAYACGVKGLQTNEEFGTLMGLVQSLVPYDPRYVNHAADQFDSIQITEHEGGVCVDRAALCADILAARGLDPIIIYMIDRITMPDGSIYEPPGDRATIHALVAVEKNGQRYYLDPTYSILERDPMAYALHAFSLTGPPTGMPSGAILSYVFEPYISADVIERFSPGMTQAIRNGLDNKADNPAYMRYGDAFSNNSRPVIEGLSDDFQVFRYGGATVVPMFKQD